MGLEDGDEAQQAANNAGKAADQGKAAGARLAPQQHTGQHHAHDGQSHLPGGSKVIAAGDRGGGTQSGEIPGEHRGAPVDRDEVIRRAPDPADNM